ncbi:sigma-70 family RNA polymerase sigma factor [Bacillus cereus group sp. BfR-BA-01448]|uniref:sigma-70 family RNA polymerase sigma factor n=1 Tax=Bacillus cereus group sp. BfR-BA-01448 TaxID=2920352 RepID=UPI001F591132|nr:sigma-70 family RNA polymerase sigma factor [Bacillus cereus group sp. BfR-BA-01448]
MGKHTHSNSDNNYHHNEEKKQLEYIQEIRKKLPLILENPIIQEFLKDKKHEEIMKEAFKNPSQKNINLLNQTSKEFYRINRVLRYCSVLIRGRAIDFDKRQRNRNKKQMLIFDKNALEGDFSAIETIGSLQDCEAERPEALVIEGVGKGNVIPVENEKLDKAMHTLTDKQRMILYYRYEKMLTNRQIAEILGETEQNVGYWVKKTLKQLKDSL